MKSLALFLLILLTLSCHFPSQPDGLSLPGSPNSTLSPDRYNVAFLIMDGVYNTELTAPFDIFHHTIFRDSIKPMNVFMVADRHEPVTTFEGIRIIPDFNFVEDTLPPIDILVIPSAEHHLDSDLKNKTMIEWVKKTGQQATYITSHCDGAFVLAESGLLDNRVCTTFPADVSLMKVRYPNLDIRENVVFVHDGKVITSAGGAKSFEASLYLTEILYGEEVAKQIAEGLVINWDLLSVPHIVVK